MAKLLQLVLIVALAGSINGFNLFTLFTDTASSVANAVKRPVVLTLRAAGKAAVAEMPGGGVVAGITVDYIASKAIFDEDFGQWRHIRRSDEPDELLDLIYGVYVDAQPVRGSAADLKKIFAKGVSKAEKKAVKAGVKTMVNGLINNVNFDTIVDIVYPVVESQLRKLESNPRVRLVNYITGGAISVPSKSTVKRQINNNVIPALRKIARS